MKRLLPLALLALALPAHADFYWLAVGIPSAANGSSNSGAGNYLVLANDDPSVEFDAVKLFDVRRTENGGTKLYKNNGQNGTPPYEGCPLGGAHYDLRLPIRDEAGNEFTFVGFAAGGRIEHEAECGRDVHRVGGQVDPTGVHGGGFYRKPRVRATAGDVGGSRRQDDGGRISVSGLPTPP